MGLLLNGAGIETAFCQSRDLIILNIVWACSLTERALRHNIFICEDLITFTSVGLLLNGAGIETLNPHSEKLHLQRFHRVGLLLNGAGIETPKRSKSHSR